MKKRYKINLHAHSQYSDGAADLEEFAIACKKLEFTAAVVTDHVYHVDMFPGLTLEKYLAEKKEAAVVSKKLDYPIIIGVEIALDEEEVLIFSDKAITDLLKRRKKRQQNYTLTDEPKKKRGIIEISDIKEVKNKYNCAVILCHPVLQKMDEAGELDFVAKKGLEILDGYERYSSNLDRFYKDRKHLLNWFTDKTAFSNSDAHRISNLKRCYNFVTENITTETELIDYIKNKKKVEFFVSR